MPTLSAVIAANRSNAPTSIRPVAVLVGGTSGIGRGVTQALAKYTNGNAHLILVGRNKAAADRIIATLPKGGQYEFVEADVSTMRNVGAVTRELSQRLGKINYLVITSGILSFKGFTPTEDGIDYKLALHYYQRFKFARDLAPLLEKAAAAGEPARMMTVLDATGGGPVHLDDLTLEKHYSIPQAAKVACSYSDAAVQALAQRHPTVSFTHSFPGAVHSDGYRRLPFGIKQIANALLPLVTVTPETCGENMVYSLFDPKLSTGAHFRDNHGEDVPLNKHLTDDIIQKIWDHSVAVCDGK